MIDEKKLLKALQGFHEREEEYKSVFDEQGIYYESQTGLIDEIIKYVQKMPKVGEWIPVSERLPEDKKSCIVTIICEDVNAKEYHEIYDTFIVYYDGGYWRSVDEDWELPYDVVAWMPMPEPWEGDENEEQRKI